MIWVLGLENTLCNWCNKCVPVLGVLVWFVFVIRMVVVVLSACLVGSTLKQGKTSGCLVVLLGSSSPSSALLTYSACGTQHTEGASSRCVVVVSKGL